MRWPLIWRSSRRTLELENYTLRDALREANTEIRRLRNTIVQQHSGGPAARAHEKSK